MQSNRLVWIGVFVGSSVGSYIPMLWGDSIFSLTSVLLGAAGAFLGIWLGWKVSQNL